MIQKNDFNNMNKFPWGKVIEKFYYDFDGIEMEVIKYHPWERNGCQILCGIVNESQILYSCEEISESSESLFYLILSFIAYKNLGFNQHGLVAGLARALEIKI